MIEIWKTIKDFSDYQISNFGKIKRIVRDKLNHQLKELTPKMDKDGYLNIGLYKDGKRLYKRVHRLVLETFNPIENMNSLEVNHKNGIKSDNKYPENIEWCTKPENEKHAHEAGLKNFKGEKHPRSKLTNKDVNEIKIYLNDKTLTQKEIGKMFNVSHKTISKIKLGLRWNHIKGDINETYINQYKCEK